MTKHEILDKLRILMPKLREDGFIIVGLFGSFARGDYSEDSDIDILYTLEDAHKFAQRYDGFGAFTKIKETKDFLAKEFGKDIDFVDKSTLSRTGKKYILKDVEYV